MGSIAVQLQLTSGRSVPATIVSVLAGKRPGVFRYIQDSRNGRLNAWDQETRAFRRQAFQSAAKFHGDALIDSLPISSFDAVVAPPSDFDQASTLLARANASIPVDLSPRFARNGSLRSGSQASLSGLLRQLTYTPAGDEAKLESILIVDESYGSGRTAATIIETLQNNGVGDDCTFCLACLFRATP